MTSAYASFIALSIGGIAVSSYLMYHHRKKQPLVCPMNHDCSVVTNSKWSRIFFLRNETLGLLFYLSLAVGSLLAFFQWQAQLLVMLLQIATGTGLLFSLFLVYVQAKIIKDYCFYCMISAILTVLLFINSFFL